MKRSISAILLMVIILTAIGCSSSSNQSADAYVEYSEKDYDGVVYKYPSSWTESDKGIHRYYYPNDSNHDEFLMISKYSLTSTSITSISAFESIFEDYIKGLTSSFENPKVSSKETERYVGDVFLGELHLSALSGGKECQFYINVLFYPKAEILFEIGYASTDKIQDDKISVCKYITTEAIRTITQVSNSQSSIPSVPAKESTLQAVIALIKEKEAFDTGNYVKGEVPPGEYAFVKFEGSGAYYCEEDGAGNIIDNENFYSFGYVKVHAAGNLETRGALIKIEALEKLGVRGAKELYEKLNKVSDWSESGYYKVGVDIDPGTYTLESMGQGYYAIKSGPVGSSNIIKNNNFSGKNSVNLKNGQYLELSRAKIYKAG